MSKEIVNRYLAKEFKKLGKSQKAVIEDLNRTQPYVLSSAHLNTTLIKRSSG